MAKNKVKKLAVRESIAKKLKSKTAAYIRKHGLNKGS